MYFLPLRRISSVHLVHVWPNWSLKYKLFLPCLHSVMYWKLIHPPTKKYTIKIHINYICNSITFLKKCGTFHSAQPMKFWREKAKRNLMNDLIWRKNASKVYYLSCVCHYLKLPTLDFLIHKSRNFNIFLTYSAV